MKRTDRKRIIKGVKYLAGSIPLAFIGPTIIYFAFGLRGEKYYLPILIFGFLAAIASAMLMLKGIRTMVAGVFND